MPQDPRAVGEARALIASIHATNDPIQQNHLWNHYYQLSDRVFPEAAALRQRYKALEGEERERFKAEYMAFVQRLWAAADPEAAYAGTLSSGTLPSAVRQRAPRRRRLQLHRWSVGAAMLTVVGTAVYAWQQLPGEPTAANTARPPWPVSSTNEPAATDGDAWAAAFRTVTPSYAATPIPAPPPSPSELIREIEAELAAEIQPKFTPVPTELRGRGDQLAVGERRFSDVYVIESDSLFYVRLPEDGGVESVAKEGATLTRGVDETARAALLDLWRKNREAIDEAEAQREREKATRIASRRKAAEEVTAARQEALEAGRWQAKAADWLALGPDQRHAARVRAYSNWQAIQEDAEKVRELHTQISLSYEYIGITDSRMTRLNEAYRRVARTQGPDFELEDAFLLYGLGREEIMRQLAVWEEEYYRSLENVNAKYPEYEARVQEIQRMDEMLPREIRLAEAEFDWDSRPIEEVTPPVGTKYGTGFIVAPGHVMTCAHVVRSGSKIRVSSTAGDSHEATVVTTDTANDWALLSVAGLQGPPIPMASGTPNVGATIYCLGYPLGGIKDSADPIVGSGNIAALQRIDGDSRFLQITAPINPGNSGGPVIDQQGRWVGMVSQKLNDLRRLQESQTVAQGLNFAVKASFIQPLLDPRSGVTLVPAEAQSAEPVSLETITARVSPSIVRIEVK